MLATAVGMVRVIILAAIMAEGMITRMAIVTSAIVPTVITTIVSAIPTALTIVIQTSVALATEVVTLEEVVDPAERAARENAGRLACMLAARAKCVVQMFCGIPTVLKGELPKC